MNRKHNSFFLIILLAGTLLFIFALFPIKNQTAGDRAISCATDDFTGQYLPDERIAFFEGKEIAVPLAVEDKQTKILGSTSEEKWIEVDLSEQKLRAWEGDKLFLETLVSTGLPWWPTPTGEFKIWTKFRYTKMEGGEGKHYYYLPNVPFVMFFEGSGISGYKGYSLHGTYWHSDFGNRRSHGCVNLPTSVAEKLYYWTTPALEDKKSMRATNDNPGTRIVIHE